VSDTVGRLLARNDVAVAAPAPQARVDEMAEHFGGALPPSLVELWRASDGVVLESLNAHILGPVEVIQLIDNGAWPEGAVGLSYLPVLDDHESNYLAAIVRGPLAFRVAYLPHDDDFRLLYHDVDSLIHALLEVLEQDESANLRLFFYDTPGDYPADSARTHADQFAARALMATDGTHCEWNYAAQLLDASNLAEWATLLETDHFVRRDVVARMEQMTDPAIRELLRRDRVAFEDFAARTVEAAREAGLDVGRRQQDVLQVGGKWMNLDGFFHRRRIRDAVPRMLAWFEDVIACRDPHNRPGHFMSD
jgi:hypothetical protein